MSESPTDVRCPICGLNLKFFGAMQRELHADSCLESLEKPNCESRPSEKLQDEVVKDEPTNKKETTSCAIPDITTIETGDQLSSPTSGNKNFHPKEEPKKALKRFKPMSKETAKPIPPRNTRMPFYKVLSMPSGSSFAVDAFCYGAIDGVSSYFLTHFHSDHYGGLSKSWNHGYIYCSPVTARLVEMKLGVDPQWIREIPVGPAVTVEDTEVIFFDANHCPGAVVILFDRNIFHTGDFRASSELLDVVKTHTSKLKAVYLDTTYLDPNRCFPDQSHVIRVCADYCLKFQQKPAPREYFTAAQPRRVLVMVGTYTIGKERIATAIANALNSKIWASPYKKKILKAIDDDELTDLLDVSDGLTCQVHMAPMGDLTVANLEEQWRFLRKHYTDLLAFVPTGWSWPTKNRIVEFNSKVMASASISRGRIQIFKVPYSEHSSYEELENFCRGIPIRRLISTVPNSHLDILQGWEQQW